MLVEPAKLDKDEDLATHISKTNLIVTFGVDLKALFNRLLKIDPNAACYKSIICLTEADFKQVLKLTADQAYLESDSMEKVNDLPGRFIEEFVEEYSEYLGVAKSVVQNILNSYDIKDTAKLIIKFSKNIQDHQEVIEKARNDSDISKSNEEVKKTSE